MPHPSQPPDRVLDLFVAEGVLEPLPGGRGTTWRAGDLALSPGGRPNARGTADAVYLMVRSAAPSRRLALDANNLILSRNDQTPEGELLRAVGRHLLQASAASDSAEWHAAVAEACVLASRC